MNKNRKKGFTLVELLVVIAILAILAVVSVVGYTSFTKKAKIADDISLTTQLNTILQANEATDGANKYPHEAALELVDGGYDVTKITPTAEKYNYVYDLNQNRMFLLDESYNVVSPSDLTLSENKVSVFGFAGSQDEVNEFNNHGYSVYLKSTYDSSSVTTSKGVDVGGNENVNVSLVSSATTPSNSIKSNSLKGPRINMAAKSTQTSYVVRTNGGTLTINNSEAVVSHFGVSTKVEIEAVATHSEYGDVEGTIEIKSGELNLESTSNVNTVLVSCVSNTDVSVNVASQASVGVVAPTTDAAQTIINNSSSIPTDSKVEKIQDTKKTSLFAGGLGTEKSPYIISSVDEFDNINAGVIKDDSCYFKLVSDIDLTKYNAIEYKSIYLINDVLDLNGHAITSNNGGVAYEGAHDSANTFTIIKNGKFVAANGGSYALCIGNEEYKGEEDPTAKNIFIENVTCEGGINVCCAKVTIRNVDSESKPAIKVNGTNYYAVWAETNAEVTIESGTFTSESIKGLVVIRACADTESKITIKGGTFIGDSNVAVTYASPTKGDDKDKDYSDKRIILSGGTYNQKPAGKLAEGYHLYFNNISSYIVAQTCPSGYTEVTE